MSKSKPSLSFDSGLTSSSTEAIFNAVRCAANTYICGKDHCKCFSLINNLFDEEEIYIVIRLLLEAAPSETKCISLLFKNIGNQEVNIVKLFPHLVNAIIRYHRYRSKCDILLNHPYLVLDNEYFNLCAKILFKRLGVLTNYREYYDNQYLIGKILSDFRFNPSEHIDIALKNNSELAKCLLDLGAIPKKEYGYCKWLSRYTNVKLEDVDKYITTYFSRKGNVNETVFYNTLIHYALLQSDDGLVLQYLDKFDPDQLIIIKNEPINILNCMMKHNFTVDYQRGYSDGGRMVDLLLTRVTGNKRYTPPDNAIHIYKDFMKYRYFCLLKQFLLFNELSILGNLDLLLGILNENVIDNGDFVINKNMSIHVDEQHKLALVDCIEILASRINVYILMRDVLSESQRLKYVKVLWLRYGRLLFAMDCLPELMFEIASKIIRS